MLKDRASKWVAECYNPQNLKSARDKLAEAYEILKELADESDR